MPKIKLNVHFILINLRVIDIYLAYFTISQVLKFLTPRIFRTTPNWIKCISILIVDTLSYIV